MRIFDLETSQCLKTLTYNGTSHGTATASTSDVISYPISNVVLSPNGKYILSSSLDGFVRLWDYMDNRVIKTYHGILGKEAISEKYNCGARFIVGTDRTMIVSGSDRSGVLVWDVQSKEIVYGYNNGNDAVLEVDVNDEVLVSCSRDGIVNVFELNPAYKKRKLLDEVDMNTVDNTRDNTPF